MMLAAEPAMRLPCHCGHHHSPLQQRGNKNTTGTGARQKQQSKISNFHDSSTAGNHISACVFQYSARFREKNFLGAAPLNPAPRRPSRGAAQYALRRLAPAGPDVAWPRKSSLL